MQEFGAGLALPADANVSAIGEAAQRILSTPSFRQNAAARGKALTGVNGAANAADEVEGLLDITQSRGSPDTRRQCVA
jgi:UDP:flavonoid glycosyltransferase YjiC (YdhE family)